MPVYTTTKEACQKHPDAITHGAPGLEGPQGGPQGPRAGPGVDFWVFWDAVDLSILRCSTLLHHYMFSCHGKLQRSDCVE